jgi:hypothetical protein
MAFTQIETWPATPSARGSLGRGAAGEGASGLLPASFSNLSARRLSASAATVVVHAALLWFLVHRLGPEPEEAAIAQPAPPAAMFTLSPLSAPESSPPRAEPVTLAMVQTPPDLSLATDMPVPEWSMTRIRAPARSSTDGAASGSAAGGGGARRLRDFIGFGDSRGGELLLDEGKLEQARQTAMRAVPDARGIVMLFLRVSPAGIVLAVESRGGSVDAASLAALKQALLGEKLFQVRTPVEESALVLLPPMRLRDEL